jgi:hypothetical protein
MPAAHISCEFGRAGPPASFSSAVRPKHARSMFTTGREREKEHARTFLGDSTDPTKLETVIDAVHDLLETGTVTDSTRAAFRSGFVDGGGGTWESTGSWLSKAAREHPSLSSLWVEFARHSSARVRFRAAAFLESMPENCAAEVLPRLLADPSAKVRSKAAADQHHSKRRWVVPLLSERRLVETDPLVIDSLDFALSQISKPGR